ncbi:MAG: Gfo/Idh/MocA family protein [Thermomicrobiales bacterium]
MASLDREPPHAGPLRAAVIGCGRMAYGHGEAYVREPRIDLVACADIFPEATARFGEQFGIPAQGQYTDFREMLRAERPDIVSICTHHHLHAPMTIETAEIAAPRAILCEKPIALDLQSADAMLDACDRAGTMLVVGHQRRFDRQTLATKRALDEGRIGEVLFVEAFGHPRSSLLVDSTHTVDLVRFLLDYPRATWVLGQVDAREHREAWGQQIEDCALAWIGFENDSGAGARLLLGAGSIMGDTPEDRVSIASRPVEGPTYHRITLHGTEGRLVLDGDRPLDDRPLVHLHRGGDCEVLYSAAEFHADPDFSAVKEEVSALVDCLETPGLVHPLEGRSARATLEILMGIYESSRRRGAVTLPLDVPDNALLTMLAEGVI